MLCKKCGCNNEKNNRFCKKCGCELGKEDIADRKINHLKVKKRIYRYVTISVIVIGVLMLISVINYAYDKTIKMEKQYLKENEYENAASCFKNAVSINKWRQEAYAVMIKYFLDKDEPELDKACFYYMKAPSNIQKKLERLAKTIREIGGEGNLYSVITDEDNNVTYGLKDITGKTVMPNSYDSIDEITFTAEGEEKFSGYYAVSLYSGWGVCDSEGKTVVEPVYDEIGNKSDADRIAVCTDEKWGFIDSKGNEVIAPQFDSVTNFSEKGVAVVSQNEKMGMINIEDEIILQVAYSHVYRQWQLYEDTGIEDYVLVKNEKYGLSDCYGNIITDVEYDYIDYVGYGLFRAEKNGQFGYIDANGYEIIPVNKKWVGYMGKNGLVIVHEDDDTFSIYDNTGNYQRKISYRQVGNFGDNGMALVGNGSKLGFADEYGNLIIGYQYDSAREFFGGFCPVCIDEKWGIIDENGNEIVPLEYGFIYNSQNVYLLQKDEKYKAYFAETGVISEKKYDDVNIWDDSFSDGAGTTLLKVEMNCEDMENENRTESDEEPVKVGIINWYGEEIIPVEYDEIKRYKDRIVCKNEDTYRMFDLEGNEIPISGNPDYMEMEINRYAYDLIPCSKDGESYFMDLDGNKVM